MWLDIGICIFILLSVFIGWRVGFMRLIIGFISSVLTFAAVLFLTRPAATLANKWFNLAGKLNSAVSGGGKILSLAICGIAIYITVWLIFWVISLIVKLLKKKHKGIDRADKIAGLFLGTAKALLSIGIFCVFLSLFNVVPFVTGAKTWLFRGSYIGQFIYDTSIKFIGPVIKKLWAVVPL